MQIKADSRGITLLELVIAISLLTVVLSSAYYLFFFSTKTMQVAEANFDAEQDARMIAMYLEEDIRDAQAVNYGGMNHKGVEVLASGMQLNVHTDADSDGNIEIVQYILDNNKLKRGVFEQGVTPVPANYSTIVHRVKNKLITPSVVIFTISGKKVNINLMILDENDRLKDTPISVNTCISVRSKGAMD